MSDSIHILPGRLRLRLAAIKGHPALARRLAARLGAEPGMLAAEANPLTGSLLLRFDPQVTSPAAIATILAEERLAIPRTLAPHPAETLGALAGRLLIDTLVQRSTAALFSALG